MIAPLAQVAGGRAQALDRTVFGFVAKAPLDGPPQRTPHAFLRITELRVEPRRKRFFKDPFRLRVGQHRKRGIDPRFDGAFAQQLGTEAVDRADLRFFEVMHGGVEQPAGVGIGRGFLPRALELFAQAQLQLAGGLFAERDGNDLIDRGALVRDQSHNAANQLRRLAGAGGGFDNQRLVELAGDELAVLLATLALRGVEGLHGIFLSASRSAKSFASLRRVRRSSSRPHTTWKSHH